MKAEEQRTCITCKHNQGWHCNVGSTCYEGELWEKQAATHQEGGEYPIALISPTMRLHQRWVHDFGINGQEYVYVSRLDHVRGRYFSAIQPGLQAWKIDPDIVDAARDRVRSKPLPQISEGEIRDAFHKYAGIERPDESEWLMDIESFAKAIHQLMKGGEG